MRPLLLVPLLLTAACMKERNHKPPVTEAEATSIAERAESSFTTGDVKAIMAHYANNAVMIDAAAPDPSADRAVQTGWAGNFNSMQPRDLRVVGRRIQLLGNDAFVSSGVETF